MRDLLQTKIRVALPATLAVQSFATMCGFAGAVVAVQAAADLGVRSTSIGIYTAVLYVTGMVSGLIAGSLLARYGVIRTCQAALLAAALGPRAGRGRADVAGGAGGCRAAWYRNGAA